MWWLCSSQVSRTFWKEAEVGCNSGTQDYHVRAWEEATPELS